MDNTKETLVTQFCTPNFIPLTEFDTKVLASAAKTEHSFEEISLPVYTWGEGKKILIVHGWGSRASHCALLARTLAKAGFQVIVYDAPAHSSVQTDLEKSTSNMFEYCRAISSVAKAFGPFHAVVGHSFGGLTACFTIAGHKRIQDYKISAEKLVMISTPISLEPVLEHFCNIHNLGKTHKEVLAEGLESGYNFLIKDYNAADALKNIETETLIIHDTADTAIPIYNIEKQFADYPHISTFITEGSGHDKILANRKMMARVTGFLEERE